LEFASLEIVHSRFLLKLKWPGPKKWKCEFCGEEMDEVQKARHIIKKHGEPKKGL